MSKGLIMRLFFIVLLLTSKLLYSAPSLQKVRTMHASLDPLSIAQHLAFYELYPNTNEGKCALGKAWELMGVSGFPAMSPKVLDETVHAFINLIDKQPDQKASKLSDEAIAAINQAASTLANRKLKGREAKSEAEILSLPPEEIDLAHAIFLSQHQDSELALLKRNYEAAIDLMALQIRSKLPKDATAEKKIRTINDFIFYDLGFRFPPETLYTKEIDRYTFLSSVIDSRRGICLGVSVLYLALAQRLGLSLEIVTPPGHIYVRYAGDNGVLNIETTARGICVDNQEYLSVDTYALQERNMKQTVGLVHFNKAADDLRVGAYDVALNAYEKAKSYMGSECLLDELMGVCAVLCGKEEMGKKLMEQALQYPSTHMIGKSTTAEDYLHGEVGHEGLKALLMDTDENRESILAKQKVLQEVIHRKPNFRAGILALAMTWMQLHRMGEALEWLKKYHTIDPNDPKVEYYLAALYFERYNYVQAWRHLINAEKLTAEYGHNPKALKELRNALSSVCPCPYPYHCPN